MIVLKNIVELDLSNIVVINLGSKIKAKQSYIGWYKKTW